MRNKKILKNLNIRHYLRTAVLLALGFALIAGASACSKTGPDGEATPSVSPSPDTTDYTKYNEQAEIFVKALADGNFDTAVSMFDEAMTKALPLSSLENEIWADIVKRAGAFVDVYEIKNTRAEGYYICDLTSRHENCGVTLRVVLSEDGLVSGLFTGGYPKIVESEARQPVEREGFVDYPIEVGTGTDYPLQGILSMPDSAEKVPAAVLVHGSGSSDMDEKIYENKPFKDIADYLAQNGIAVIRYDKRPFVYGIEMTNKLGGSLSVREETIEDAILATNILKTDPRIDANRVFIIGHSMGGMLAPRISAEGGDFAGIISLAGSPRSLLTIMYDQQMGMINAMPEGEEKEKAMSQMASYEAQMAELMALSDDAAKAMTMTGGVSAYYYKEMDSHPVSSYVKDIDAPFLILQGEDDFQVLANADFDAWKKLLDGRDNVSFKLYENLNHLFMSSTGRGIADYEAEYKIPNHVDETVLADIAAFINAN